jgi:hypothetical protein
MATYLASTTVADKDELEGRDLLLLLSHGGCVFVGVDG